MVYCISFQHGVTFDLQHGIVLEMVLDGLVGYYYCTVTKGKRWGVMVHWYGTTHISFSRGKESRSDLSGRAGQGGTTLSSTHLTNSRRNRIICVDKFEVHHAAIVQLPSETPPPISQTRAIACKCYCL
jgi:hypothetical protein